MKVTHSHKEMHLFRSGPQHCPCE